MAGVRGKCKRGESSREEKSGGKDDGEEKKYRRGECPCIKFDYSVSTDVRTQCVSHFMRS